MKNFNQTCCKVKIKMIIMDLQMKTMDGFKASELIYQYYDQFHTDPKFADIERP